MLDGNIQTRKYPAEGLVIFSFIGDFIDPDYIIETINPAINEFRNIVLDVQKLEYINSASFGSFFEIVSKADYGKSKICFMNPNKKFKIISSSLGANKFFNSITSLNEL